MKELSCDEVLMAQMVMADGEETIAQLRKLGSLRASRYNFQAACVAEVVKAIYDARFLLTVRPDQLIYLESVRALHRLAPDVRRLREGIVTLLRLRKKEAFKLRHPLIFYFGLLGECFDRRDSRAFTAFVPEKLLVFHSSNNINSHNHLTRGVLNH